jgi:catechol-2,3-dioxygenase
MNLSHCHIQIKDMAVARRFYEGVFEFKEDVVCDENEVFLRNSADFVLGLEKVENPEVLPKWFHFGFDVKNEEKLREVFSRVKELGFPVLREIMDFDASMNFYCADPVGTQIEVYFNRQAT